MSLEEDTVFCIQLKNDSNFLWNDLFSRHMGSSGHGRFGSVCERVYTQILSDIKNENIFLDGLTLQKHAGLASSQ